jgi:hypothetical protein
VKKVPDRLMQHLGLVTVPDDAEDAARRAVSSAFSAVTADCVEPPKSFVKVLTQTQTGICRKMNTWLKKWRKKASGVSSDVAIERVEDIVEKSLTKMRKTLGKHSITPSEAYVELDLLEDDLINGLEDLIMGWKP